MLNLFFAIQMNDQGALCFSDGFRSVFCCIVRLHGILCYVTENLAFLCCSTDIYAVLSCST